MTEEEAKTKWCPFTRTTASGIEQVGSEWHSNRPSFADVADSGFDLCIGSACMAWRWGVRTYARTGGGYGASASSTHGFCGLAGASS